MYKLLFAIILGLVVFKPSPTKAMPSLDKIETNADILSLLKPKEEIKPEAAKTEPKIHTVVEGDNLTKIANQFDTTTRRLFGKNTSIEHPDKLSVGLEIVIPETNEALGERSWPTEAQTSLEGPQNGVIPYVSPSSFPAVYRGFSKGQCTYYAQLSRPDKSFRGNAGTWIRFANGTAPKIGAVAVNTWAAGGLGHVAIVVAIDKDRVLVRHMNYKGRGVLSEDWMSTTYWRGYIY